MEISEGLDFGCSNEIGVAVSIGEKVSSVSRSGLKLSSDCGDSRSIEYLSYRKSDKVASDAWRRGLGEGGNTTRLSSKSIGNIPSSSGMCILSGGIRFTSGSV